ncbi:rhomboid family intramembrane serine protease [Streptococcus pyogenes]|uniref:rhomboid family intramembrane serine protease n=1 Tax=Streptococcus pyogenes TaxID=1314 RepID=UPI000E07C58A|nr:rhomboid family protein [Streptococcus pyogenes]
MTRLLKRYPITIFLLGLTGLIFIAMQVVYGHLATGAQAIYQVGGMFGLLVKAMPDQLWRLVTPIFIHIGFWSFFCQWINTIFCWSNRRRPLGFTPFFITLCFIRCYGQCLYFLVDS